MEIEVGQMIEHQNGLMRGIIVNRWQQPSDYAAGMVDCIRLFLIYDQTAPIALNQTITMRDFKPGANWRVIN